MKTINEDNTLHSDSDIHRQVIDSFLEIHNSTASITIGRRKTERLYLLHGLVSHVFESVGAALILIDNNHSHLAKALARIAFEHAIIAQWSHLHPDGLQGLQEKVSINYRKYYQEADRLIKMPEVIQKAFEEMTFPSTENTDISQFKNTCNAFKDTEWFYITYRILSGVIHPSNSTLKEYFIENPDSAEYPTLLNKVNVQDTNPILFTLALSCSLASGVYEDIRKAKPYKAKIRKIAKSANLPTMLTLKSA